MPYSPTTFVDNSAPAISAAELNKMGAGIADADSASALGWVDTFNFGAKSDLTRNTNGAITSAGTTLTGTFAAANGDAGKLALVIGAGTATSRTDGAMTTTAGTPAGRDANVLTSAGAAFTSALVGQRIIVNGAGSGGSNLTCRVWGVISATQLRLTANSLTTVSAATYTISADLYAGITASTATTATLDTAAGTTISSGAEYFYGTDDSTAINNAFASLSGNGGQIFHRGASALGSAITTNKSGALMEGSGGFGYSRSLAFGETRFMAMKPNMVCFRYGNAGDRVVKDAAMTAASATLTSATANFAAGDVGKTVSVLGAGAQTGSSTQQSLETTISGFTNSTTVTLAASATTTVVGAFATITSQTNNTNGGPMLSNIHFMGCAGAMGGVHFINANNGILENVTCSDFYSGFGLYADGTAGNSQYWTISGCNFNDDFIGVKEYKTNIAIVGGTIDGNSNLVDRVPGPGTIGIDGYDSVEVTQTNIQAYETCIRCDGHAGGGTVQILAVGFEGFVTGVDLHSDAASGGNGGYIGAKSWSTSSVGGTAGTAINLRANVKNTVIFPGFWFPGNITILTQDATVTGTVDLSGTILPVVSGGDAYKIAPHTYGTFHPGLGNNTEVVSPAANDARWARVEMSESGHLRDVSVLITTTGGNMKIGILDTGQANATHTTRTCLAIAVASATPGATAWYTFDPNLAVTAGDTLEFFVTNSTTAAVIVSSGGPGGAGTLPTTSFFPSSGVGTSSQKSGGTIAAANVPAAVNGTVTDGNMVAAANLPLFVWRIS